MAKQIKARRMGGKGKVQISSRELWLAGLGAVSLGRKQARATFAVVNAGAVKFERRVRNQLVDVVDIAAERTELVRTQAEGLYQDVRGFVVPAGIRAEGLVAEAILRADRLAQPLLAKLGVVNTGAGKRGTPTRRKPAAGKRKATPSATSAAARKAPVRRARSAA